MLSATLRTKEVEGERIGNEEAKKAIVCGFWGEVIKDVVFENMEDSDDVLEITTRGSYRQHICGEYPALAKRPWEFRRDPGRLSIPTCRCESGHLEFFGVSCVAHWKRDFEEKTH